MDGTIVEGLAEIPGNPSPTPIAFKTSDDAKKQKLRCDDIKTIIYYFGNNGTVEYDRMNVYYFEGDKKPSRIWLQALQRGSVTLYTCVYLTPGGTFGSKDKFDDLWFCYRTGEEIATRITATFIKNKQGYFTTRATNYFQDDPELIKKIKDDQYKWNEMGKIVEEYNARKKQSL